MIYLFLIFISLILLDIVWIGFVASKKYREDLGHMLILEGDKIKFRKISGIILYIFLAILIYMFSVPVYVTQGINMTSLLSSFALGILLYGFYEFTNRAILKDWPKSIIILDTLWGGLLVTLSSCITYIILK